MIEHPTDLPEELPKPTFGMDVSAPQPGETAEKVNSTSMVAQGVGWAVPTKHKQLWWAQPTLRLFQQSPHVSGQGLGASAVPSPRREWLTAAFRWLALAGLATVATILGLRRSPDTNPPDCARERLCGQCGLHRQCALPRATAWRDSQERNT